MFRHGDWYRIKYCRYTVRGFTDQYFRDRSSQSLTHKPQPLLCTQTRLSLITTRNAGCFFICILYPISAISHLQTRLFFFTNRTFDPRTTTACATHPVRTTMHHTHGHARPHNHITHHAPRITICVFSRKSVHARSPVLLQHRANTSGRRRDQRSKSLVAHWSLGLGGSLFRRTASDMRRACFLACFLIWSTASPTWWEMSAEVVVDVVATAAEPGGE